MLKNRVKNSVVLGPVAITACQHKLRRPLWVSAQVAAGTRLSVAAPCNSRLFDHEMQASF